MLTETTTTNERPRTDPYTGDARTPHSTPLDVALAAIANLDINPLCADPAHAERLLREDMQKIVRVLATALGGNQATVAAQNLAIERLQRRVEIGGRVVAILAQLNREFGVCECGLESCSICGQASVWGQVRVALAEWEEAERWPLILMMEGER